MKKYEQKRAKAAKTASFALQRYYILAVFIIFLDEFLSQNTWKLLKTMRYSQKYHGLSQKVHFREKKYSLPFVFKE